MSATPAGWYPDPNAPGTERFWDGNNWTQQTRAQTPSFTAPAGSSSDPFASVSGGQFGTTFPSSYSGTATSMSSGRFISFGEAIKRGFVRYTTWRGRAPRSEYWFWVLFYALLYIGALIIDATIFVSTSGLGFGVFTVILSIALFLPNVAVFVRRLHDTNKSAHFLWLILVPIGGAIALLVFTLLPSHPGTNRYGNPGE